MTPLRIFRYSGNKARYLHHYRPPPDGTARIIEPYLGSGAYTLNQPHPGIGYELNADLCETWWWLQQAAADDLHDLHDLVTRSQQTHPKQDVRELGLQKGPETYVRLNVCSAVVGQLSSWRIYPQHRLPIEHTIRALPHLHRITVLNKPGETHLAEPGDTLFIDPPYIGTTGNYQATNNRKLEHRYQPSDTINLVNNNPTTPTVVTYGTNAATVFPNWKWTRIATRNTPNLRNGGTTPRHEHVTYLNWSTNPDTLF